MHIKILLVIAAIIFSTVGCSEEESGREYIDRSGRTVIINRPINRIVSTAPSNTEIITGLGIAHKLVAIDSYSANVPDIPQGLVLLDFSFPDAEVLISLNPDIIIAHGHNPTGSGEDPFRVLREAGIPVAYISMSRSIEDIYKDIAFIAEILQEQERGDELITLMRSQIEEIKRQSAHIETRKTVYFEISAAPEMFTFGRDSFLSDMISVIGAINIFENDNWIVMPSAESIIERNPDVIITNVNYIDDPIGEIKSRPGFNHINAVINNRVYQIDTDSSVRPSQNIILTVRQMAHAVYPELHEKP